MRPILKLAGILFGVFLCVVVLTSTVSFIRHTWFSASAPSASNHVRVLEVSGVIVSSSHLVDELKEIAKNKKTRAVVVRVNSPGGLVAPSQEIFQALRKTNEKIPVVISMGSVAASGGYYIALGGRSIFANPGTLTGSIGVVMEFINTQKLYQWAKIERFALTSGKFKDAGSPLRPMLAEERALFQGLVSDIYTQFRGAVGEHRKLDEEKLNAVTDGRVITGSQALAAGLIDKLGGLQEAIDEAKQLAKLPEDAPTVFPDKTPGLLRKILTGEVRQALSEAVSGSGLGPWLDSLDFNTLTGPRWRILWLAPIQ